VRALHLKDYQGLDLTQKSSDRWLRRSQVFKDLVQSIIKWNKILLNRQILITI
jgi:hypothetical protein